MVRGGRGARPVTFVDGRTRLLVGGPSPSARAADAADALAGALEGRPVETVSPSRGKGLAAHADVNAGLGGARFFFCLPHSPWRKGTAENAGGLIRELLPKGTDLSRVTGEEVERAFALIDGRPRRVPGYGTAGEAYREELLHSA